MVEHQPSKLDTRVRFPLPALFYCLIPCVESGFSFFLAFPANCYYDMGNMGEYVPDKMIAILLLRCSGTENG